MYKVIREGEVVGASINKTTDWDAIRRQVHMMTDRGWYVVAFEQGVFITVQRRDESVTFNVEEVEC